MSRMFDKLLFSNRLGKLELHEVDYWRMMFGKILKVGEEFEVEVPKGRNIGRVIEDYKEIFEPTGNVDRFGKYGIYDIVTDGSVRNGIELITVGRRFNWKTFVDMNKMIMEKFNDMDFSTSYHTGFHCHLLAGYSGNNGTSELERPVPEIILANYYQLHRHFCPELYWLASSGDKRWALTRYVLFRRPPFDYSAINHGMDFIRSTMNDKYGKYQMFNMNHSLLRYRQCTRFHVEIRHPDNILSPSYASALVALEVALLQKAIDLSQCGILLMKQDEYDIRKELFDKFVNLGSGLRESDSIDLTDEDIETLKNMSLGMIKWLKSELIGINHHAYTMLQKMAFCPASLARTNGFTWEDIEYSLTEHEQVDETCKNNLMEIMVLQQITDCKTQTQWKKQVSNKLSMPMTRVNELLDYIGKERILVWDNEIGSMLFKQIV